MGFSDIIRSGVSLANKLTGDLQVQVTVQAWIGEDGVGGVSYAPAVSYGALVDQTIKQTWSQGKLVTVKAEVDFLFPIVATTPIPGQRRINPIDPRDLITLPDGTTGPIMMKEGFLDSSTGAAYMHQVYLGA